MFVSIVQFDRTVHLRVDAEVQLCTHREFILIICRDHKLIDSAILSISETDNSDNQFVVLKIS